MKPETAFTAAELGNCVDSSPQNVRKILKDVAPSARRIVSGVEAAAWGLGSLPSPLIAKLAHLATRHGYATPLQLLQNAPRSAQLTALSHVANADITRAQKLQRALASCLHSSPEVPIAQLSRIAAPDYLKQFGTSVSDRYLRELINRTLQRDRGERNFARLELYIPDRTSRRRAKASPLTAAFQFQELDDAFSTIPDRTKPTLVESAFCWRKVVEVFADRIASNANEAKLKQQLRQYILRSAPFLAQTPAAVKRGLNRKIREAFEHGIDTIVDGRVEAKRTATQPQDFDVNCNLLANHAANHCGYRLSQAYRQLHLGNGHDGVRFSEEFRSAYPFNARKKKSRVPNCVRNAARPILAAIKPEQLGSRAARLAMPSIRRDWSGVAAGASYTSDDWTFNHYVYDWNDRGEYEFNGRRFNIVRPQVLPVIDERTGNPLGFSLAPAPTYNSRQIRTLITRICMRPEIGLPFERFVFEAGIWKARNVEALAQWASIDESFARHGICLKVRHVTTPKAKVIEQAIGAFQNLDEDAPGYIGRGEQQVKHERVQRFLLQLKRVDQPIKAEVDPSEMLMSTEQSMHVIEDSLKRFAAEPQNGVRLDGLSPAEGWAQLTRGKVHRLLPESLRFLLGTDESHRKVTNEGIELRIGNAIHYYFGSEQLGALIGEKVCVRYNDELPEQIIVSHPASDPRGLRPFSVPMFKLVPAHGANREQFREAREHQNRFVSYGRAKFRELVPTSNKTICRQDIGSPELRAAGEAHNRLERQMVELNAERDTERVAIERLAAERNRSIDAKKVRRPSRVAKHLRSAQEWEAKIKALEANEQGQSIPL